MSTAAAFESVAVDYDLDFGENPVARMLRRTVWEELFTRLRRGSSVLDLGCGTGIDACEAARRGHQIVAADGAEAMLDRTRSRRDHLGLTDAIELVPIDLNHRPSRRSLLSRVEVDAVISNFGVMNCIDDLDAFAFDVGEGLPSGALFFAVVMGRIYPWEIAYHLLKARPRRAFERFGRGPAPVTVGHQTVPVRYYSPSSFCRPFLSGFRVVHLRALGAFLPPPYLARRLVARGIGIDGLARLELGLGTRWPFRTLGDHFLAVLERR